MTVVACKPKPDKFDLGDLPKKIEDGDITIPQFQRQYVWNLEDCAKLLDSVFKGYPIGTLPDYVPLQAMAMCLHKSCTKDAILALTSEEVSKNWVKVDKAFSEAIDYLRIEMRIPVSDLLPYDVLVIPFVYFMYKNKGRKPSAGQAKWLKAGSSSTAGSSEFAKSLPSASFRVRRTS